MQVRVDVIKMLIITGFVLGALCLVRTAHGGEKTYLQTSNLDSQKTVVYDYNPNGQGRAKGYQRKSNFDPRKTVVYDHNSNGQDTGCRPKGLSGIGSNPLCSSDASALAGRMKPCSSSMNSNRRVTCGAQKRG